MENKSIIRATYVFAGLFLLMVLYFSYYLVFKSDEHMNNSYNKLADRLSETTIRGTIYGNDGEVLAETKNDEDGNEYRYYPYNDLFCHAVGSIDYGKYGIESLYNYQLLSTDISWISKMFDDIQGEKYQGNNIITTFDVKLQQKAYEAMSKYKGAVVVMEADTGKVLTMLSNPSYNPNEAKENWDTISQDENSPILNRATLGLYTPGSIFKLFTLEEYLEEGNNAEGYSFTCNGVVSIADQTIGCANMQKHGTIGLLESFADSCNGAFINIGQNISVSGLNDLCDRLLFNNELPIGFLHRQSSFSLNEDDDEFLKAQTYFGQGETLVTPMHMALICSAISNDGVLMKTMFVEKIENAYGSTVEKYEPEEYEQLFTKQQAETLKTYMRSVVETGTAVKLNQYENLTVYGKTGTAQINNNESANSWFIGFAQGGEKKYAIAVVCEEVSENTSPAVTVARDVLKVLD